MNHHSRALLALLLLAVLLPAPLMAQSSGSSGAVAPLQTLIDVVPTVVSSAITEAERDATPDEADRLVSRMDRYAVGFEDGSAWPEGSDASTLPMDEVLRYATTLVDLTRNVPPRVAAVARVGAACDSWQANVTGPEILEWAFQARPAALQLGATADGFEQMHQTAPVDVDVAPIREAAARLDAYLDAEAAETNRCLEETAARLGVPLSNDFLTASVSPKRTWPHGTITVFGGSLDPDRHARVHIVAGELGLNVTQTLSLRGTFFIRHTVPGNATFGDHPIMVSTRTNETELSVEVDRIPVRLRIAAPDAVPIGDAYALRVSVASVVPGLHPTRSLEITGDLTGTGPANATLRIDAIAPDAPTTVRGAAHYSGDEWFRPAERGYEIVVYDPALAVGGAGPGATGEGTAPDTAQPAEAGAVEEFLRIRIPFIFDYEVPLWVALILGAIVLFLLWEGLVYLRAWKTPVHGGGAAAAIADDGTSTRTVFLRGGPGAPPTFGRLFLQLHQWALRVRIARSSETVREVARRYSRGNPALVRSVVAFEQVRYGGRPESRSPLMARRLVSAWRGVVDRLRR